MASQPDLKASSYERVGRVAGALASPQRLELVELLAQGERSVEDLARLASLSIANASRHLQLLRSADLVTGRRAGRRVFYRLASPAVLEAFRSLRALAESATRELSTLAAEYFEAADGAEPVPLDELRRRLARGEAVVIDVRPRTEYLAGHVAGAISVPLAELEERLAELPDGGEVVAYCRGRYCALAADAVRMLRRHGRAARRLADGYPDWRDAGLPVEVGDRPRPA